MFFNGQVEVGLETTYLSPGLTVSTPGSHGLCLFQRSFSVSGLYFDSTTHITGWDRRHPPTMCLPCTEKSLCVAFTQIQSPCREIPCIPMLPTHGLIDGAIVGPGVAVHHLLAELIYFNCQK